MVLTLSRVGGTYSEPGGWYLLCAGWVVLTLSRVGGTYSEPDGWYLL